MSTQVNKIYVQMGNIIKDLRKKKCLTQGALGEEIGVSSGYIAQLEQGRKCASDNLLQKLETFFQLETNTLLNLRDSQSIDPIEIPEVKAIPDATPIALHDALDNPIEHFMKTLLSCEKEYVLQKIPNWLKELEEGLFNQLKIYELTKIKEHIMSITSKWVGDIKINQTTEDDSPSIQGCIAEDEHKHFFSLQLNHHILTLNCVNEDKQIVTYFEQWLGTSSISYTLTEQLPYFGEEKEVSYFLWFNPLVSITEMYSYLKQLPQHINNIEMNEPRLNWYINKLNA